MRSPAEHIDAHFAEHITSFASELDERAREHFPAVVADTLRAYGLPKDQMSARETAFVDALLAGILQVVGEIVGLAMRRSADLVVEALSEAQLGYTQRAPAETPTAEG
jgi:hypothetical protein